MLKEEEKGMDTFVTVEVSKFSLRISLPNTFFL